MNQSSSRALAESPRTTAGELLRGALRLLWHAVRLPVYTFLAILEPVVRFIRGGARAPTLFRQIRSGWRKALIRQYSLNSYER